MKKALLQAISLILMLMMALAIGSCSKGQEFEPALEPEQTPEYVSVTYKANIGGYLTGNNFQKIEKGDNTEAVTAIPNTGYEFVKWSDGNTEATRRDYNVTEDITITAEFKIYTYNVRYIAGEHGSIQGNTEQTVDYNKNGTRVVAVADTGYEFMGWSDGVQTAYRIDKNVKDDLLVTANFTPNSKTYALNYNFGTAEEKVEAITLTYGSYDNAVFPVPQREHFTFKGWYYGDLQVTDAESNLLISNNTILNGEVTEINAKWTANETFTYKILLVYVTEIQATLPTRDQSTTIDVNYKMSQLEREFCHLTTLQLKRYMNKLTDGLVEFEIDEYFTNDAVLTESFRQGRVATGICNSLFPNDIEEVSEILNDYDSVLSVFSMDDLDYKLHDGSGAASARYGEVNFDSFLSGNKLYRVNLEEMIEDLEHYRWKNFIETFIHEHSHTIEQRVNLYNYHTAVVGRYIGMNNFIEVNREYYLNEAVMEGKKIGIPYYFWKGEVYKVNYLVSQGRNGSFGHISSKSVGIADPIGSGNMSYEVVYGDNMTVTAIPSNGYRFVEWSDGVTTATRTDTNITREFTVTAILEPIDYELTIKAEEGGNISIYYYPTNGSEVVRAESNLFIATLHRYEGRAIITAVAEDGYKFVGWSDGDTSSRKDFCIYLYWTLNVMDLFDENNQYTLTAIFEKIE